MGTILTLAFLPTYVAPAQAEPDDSIKQLFKPTEMFCDDDRRSQEFHRMVPNIIFHQYELSVCSAPWKRHPTTKILRQIFEVHGFHPPRFLELNHLHLGESIDRSP